jgi:hypothetical protein
MELLSVCAGLLRTEAGSPGWSVDEASVIIISRHHRARCIHRNTAAAGRGILSFF